MDARKERSKSDSGGATLQMTRQQRYLARAFTNVSGLTDSPETVRKIYGGMCHKLPILVRADGLCQTLAYVEQKAAGPDERATAYRHLRAHLADALGVEEKNLLSKVRSVGVIEYIHFTRTLLGAWTYYKRFAVSVLHVEAGADEDVS